MLTPREPSISINYQSAFCCKACCGELHPTLGVRPYMRVGVFSQQKYLFCMLGKLRGLCATCVPYAPMVGYTMSSPEPQLLTCLSLAALPFRAIQTCAEYRYAVRCRTPRATCLHFVSCSLLRCWWIGGRADKLS